MPMGLKNALATLQRLMDKVLRGLQNVEMLVYLDDIIVYAKDLQEHDSKVRRLFDRLRGARLILEPEKVHFLRKEVGFLGHIVSERGVEMDPKKIEVMTNFLRPKTVRNVRQFLGMAGYYRRFIQGFSKIAKPLHDMTKKGVKFEWTSKQETSFKTLKTCLTTTQILIFPDFSKPFTLTTDSSDLAIGAVLSQERDGFDHPIGYLSRVLNEAEVNYSTTEKECLATLYAMYHYRPYLLGQPFTLVADHEPLNWMHNRKDPGQKLMRWMFKFTDYQYTFKYRPGKENVVANCLSRNPIIETPEAEINQRLPVLMLLRVLMHSRKKTVIELASEAGFVIYHMVCDQSACNRSAVKQLGITIDNPFFTYDGESASADHEAARTFPQHIREIIAAKTLCSRPNFLTATRLVYFEKEKECHHARNPRPRSDSPAPNTNPRTIQQPRKEPTLAPDLEASCIALRTRFRLPSIKTPALPTPPVTARVDTGLRRSKGKTPKTSRAQQSAPPSPKTVQRTNTDRENPEAEDPSLADPHPSQERQSAPPSEPSTSMAVQCSSTD
ncbi:unnamed protein product [Trichogramma brassicae]|uniref:RNA-directed DNA polymerase n=1 Tax=Trichogramma brassicae TaxID=86971 RepID=A0A6H5J064_9HYME|nr:unnamed protein product [Trichogramma brassicae]